MQKERRVLPVSSSRPRVSPYPLRSSRNNKQKEPESPLQSEGAKQWEDVHCVICMEPPHNAVLLHCSSFSKGCRPYMCDTSSRHSNCFKQYRRSNTTSRYEVKTLNCPLCRGEVYGTMKVTSARRFMNAKPRTCSIEDCGFSGTYSQLKTHLKTSHPDFTPPKIDPWKQYMWEQMEREAAYIDILSAAEIQRQRWTAEQRVEMMHQQHQIPFGHSVFQVSLGGVVEDLYGSSVGSSHSRATAYIPRLEFRATF
ncbi:PREDICTED: uncharacterized protein LOC104808224 [Tarenaya hassleriana]|uniref:uncharacterized protein LOC104808224 n=1 Tax=Tarenaya hassleriana TaxID=28532 RepID=UPI00053C118C|nr:PREDICTED: uncharacterized protein LOC104808224 [Tarenaya hassleriana]XP_010532161.1 PREDICTED: uncharacterized protein LOC104808224 [Tarenaya hassleriana]